MSKIVFVDGPNGVGKDYFINNLSRLLEENNETFIIKSIKDYMSEDNPIINIRQFSREFFKVSFYNLDVLDAHTKCVNDVIKIAEQEDYDYILINRSIFSYIIYNLHMPKIVINAHGRPFDGADKITREQYKKVNFDIFSIYEKLFNTKSQTYLFLLYDNLKEGQIIKRMEDSRGVKFSDYEHLMLVQILSKYAEFYNAGIEQFYCFNEKNIIKSSEHELAYKLINENNKITE